ncbi:hypothetical protein [Insolitispirillum peregrinum]|uniref:hypothetical protein n=1 Tax=Insolitispirillum peregrinum TaxID=80876 RepID=UPI003610262C
MGMLGGGGSATPTVATITPTKAASMADSAVQDAYAASRKRYSAAGTNTTVLTSGSGASGATTTGGKTLLGQ